MPEPDAPPARRRFLAAALAQAGLAALAPQPLHAAVGPRVDDVAGLHPVEVARIAEPHSTDAVVDAIRDWNGAVAIGGARYSMGGQVAARGGLHLDLRQLDRLVWIDPARRRARVQAGMRWRDLQDALDRLDLAVHTMQSFADFSIGGAVSVNAHGRYVGHGPVGHSVQALQLVLADGRVVEADRRMHADLFRAAIGGYGAVGVITEVELALAENIVIERRVEPVPLADYPQWFRDRVLADDHAVLHNADLLPPAFDAPIAVTWRRAAPDTPLTDPERLVPRGGHHRLAPVARRALVDLPGAPVLRRTVVDPWRHARPAVRRLNREASLDVAQLGPPSDATGTYVLQEYFVPEPGFAAFVRALPAVLRHHRVEVLNISIRHTRADRDALLAWATSDVFSFVLYLRQRRSPAALAAAADATRSLVDLALHHGGRHYLPYQPHATRTQVEAAYPGLDELRRVKARHDPEGRFTSEFWRRYL